MSDLEACRQAEAVGSVIRRFNMLGDCEAVFSDCEKYRPYLKQVWDATLPLLNCCLLNPSKATHEVSDPTVQRQGKRARLLGFGGLIVTNINDWRSTDPNELYSIERPSSQINNAFIKTAATESAMVICGWGSHGELNKRGDLVRGMLRDCCPEKLHYLKLSDNTGHPWHPLYLGYDIKPQRWNA